MKKEKEKEKEKYGEGKEKEKERKGKGGGGCARRDETRRDETFCIKMTWLPTAQHSTAVRKGWMDG
jgi:hypothetical protein